MRYILEGLGFYLPEKLVSNQDLERLVDTSDEWITTRTGIRTRYYAAEHQAVSDLSLAASQAALQDAGLTPADLTHILVATFTPDLRLPSSACLLQNMLGADKIPAFDLHAACSGFLYALDVARGFVSLRPDARVLVVGSEKLSSCLDFHDRSTCVLFGDGAGAAVVTGDHGRQKRCEVLDIILRSDGSMADLLKIHSGGSRFPFCPGQEVSTDALVSMQGREVFKSAVRCMVEVSSSLLEKNGLAVADIDLFIPHQANMRSIDAVAGKLNVAEDRVYVNVNNYGNTSAASVPSALAEAWQTNKIKPGQKVLLCAFGAGFTWGAALLQF